MPYSHGKEERKWQYWRQAEEKVLLGYELKMIPGNSRTGYITKTIPDRERLQRKVDGIANSIKKIPRNYSKEQFIGEINRINSQIRGVIQY